MPRTRPLDAPEIRVLGALMEKELATPDYYPLTLKALIAACNQKNGREPVTAYGEEEVRDTLERLRADVLVWRTDGARVHRYKHSLDRRWQLDEPAKAVMCLLLLRGPQTAGELRNRSERLHAFASVDEVDEVLDRLASGFDALVRQLPRQPGQRESRWTHLAAAESSAGSTAEPAAEPRPTHETLAPPDPPPRRAVTDGASSLAERVERLEATVAVLRTEIDELRRA